jgi:hypothetical protein
LATERLLVKTNFRFSAISARFTCLLAHALSSDLHLYVLEVEASGSPNPMLSLLL